MPDTVTKRLLPVPLDVGIPADYWTVGAAVPAGATFQRWDRFNTYRDLYDGDWSSLPFGDTYEIQDNYFASIVDFWADLMLSYPPMLAPENPIFQSDLHKALYEAITDYWRYGVGVLYPSLRDGEPHVEAVDPRLWYPMPGGEGDVILRFVDNTWIDVGILPLDGQVTVDRYEIAGSTPFGGGNLITPASLMISPYATVLGPHVERTTFDSVEGRGVYPVAAPPTYGDWGTSAYPSIASMVLEVSKCRSDISVILSEHTYPLMMEIGEPDSPNANAGFLDKPTEGEEDAQVSRRIYNARRRGERVKLDPGVEIRYAEWNAELEFAFRQLDQMLSAIFTHTRTPTSIFGLQSENAPIRVSGEALRRTFIPSLLKSRQLQTLFLGAINGCLDALDITAEIAWPEPLEQLDIDTRGTPVDQQRQDVVRGSEGGEDDAEEEMRDEPEEGAG